MTNGSTLPDLGGLLDNLLKNPDMLKSIAGMLGQLTSALPATPEGDNDGETTNEASKPSPLSALLPLLNGIGGEASGEKEMEKAEEEAVSSSIVKQKDATETTSAALGDLLPVARLLPSLLSGAQQQSKDGHFDSKKGNNQMKERRCLLAALRPFLSPSRVKTLELLLGVLDIWALLAPDK